MLNWMVGLIPTAVVLGVLIFVHELGHFVACRICGVRVEKFSIGFGPALFSWRRKDTTYVIALIPFGGYVKPGGESKEDVKERGLRKDDYLAQGAAKKFLIIFSGAFLNYVLGFVLFVTVFFAGHPVLSNVVGNLVEGYPAEDSGLKKGDQIVAVDGKPVNTWVELTELIHTSEGRVIRLEIDREGKARTFAIEPTTDEVKTVFGETKRISRIGIYPSQDIFVIERYGFLASIKKGADALVSFTKLTYKAIFCLVTGRLSLRALTGPVGIMALTARTANLGIIYLVQLTAILSVSLAIFNLLPIPALDGGHLLFLLIEAVRRKSIRIETQEKFTQLGYLLLIILMAVVMYNDVIRLNLVDKVRALLGSG